MTERQITPLTLTSVITLEEYYEINCYWDQTSMEIKLIYIYMHIVNMNFKFNLKTNCKT